MLKRYATIYETAYGVVEARFKEKMSFTEAEAMGKQYCQDNNYLYIETKSI